MPEITINHTLMDTLTGAWRYGVWCGCLACMWAFVVNGVGDRQLVRWTAPLPANGLQMNRRRSGAPPTPAKPSASTG